MQPPGGTTGGRQVTNGEVAGGPWSTIRRVPCCKAHAVGQAHAQQLFLLAVHLDDRDADDEQAGFDAAVLDGDADALGLRVGVLVAELHPRRKDQLRLLARWRLGLLRRLLLLLLCSAEPAVAAVAGRLRRLGRRWPRPGRAAGAAPRRLLCHANDAVPIAASRIVAVNVAKTLLAVRAFADMIRYVIRCPSIPAGFRGAARAGARRLSRRLKKGRSVTRDCA